MSLSDMEKQCLFIAELIEIARALQDRSDQIEEFFGGEQISFLDDEIYRLRKVVLNLSNATRKKNEYHDRLVELGAANVGWRCLEDVSNKLYADDSTPMEIAQWLLDHGAGKVFGTIDSLDDPSDDENELGIDISNANMVKSNGLLQPRDGDSEA